MNNLAVVVVPDIRGEPNEYRGDFDVREVDRSCVLLLVRLDS